MGQPIEAYLAELKLEDDLHLLEIQIPERGHGSPIRLIVDSPEGVTIGQITRLTKELRADEVLRKYSGDDTPRLEISSPGVHMGLRKWWQHSRHIGRMLDVVLLERDPEDGESIVLKGKLAAVSEDVMTLETGEGPRDLKWDEIEKSLVQLEW